jgi:hypothetical protein
LLIAERKRALLFRSDSNSTIYSSIDALKESPLSCLPLRT